MRTSDRTEQEPTPMSPKPPAARGFTRSERRSLHFEGVALWMVLLVAVIAAVISFRALSDVGLRMGMAWTAPLLPVAFDGFGIACSAGIVRSQSAGETGRERVSEWIGLFVALGLSIAGNVNHALISKAATVPSVLAILYAAAIPIVVAFGIHVYGRAMSKGISAYVMADDPNTLHFDVQSLSDVKHGTAPMQSAPARKAAPARPTAPRQPSTSTAPAAPRQTAPSAPAPSAASAPSAVAPRKAPSGRKMSPEKQRAYDLYDAAVSSAPQAGKPSAQPILDVLVSEFGETVVTGGALRKWLIQFWAADPRNPDNGAAEQPAPELRAADPEQADPIVVEASRNAESETRPMRVVG